MAQDLNETSIDIVKPLGFGRYYKKSRYKRSKARDEKHKKKKKKQKPIPQKIKPEDRQPRPLLESQYRLRKLDEDFRSMYKISKDRMRHIRRSRRKKRRIKKWRRARRKARAKPTAPNCGTVIKFSLGTRMRVKKKQKMIEARRLRAQKRRRQRVRKIKGLRGNYMRKVALKKRVQRMTVAQLKRLLSRRKFKRFRKLRRITLKERKLMSVPKRKALEAINKAVRIAKHRKRKQMRFKRWIFQQRELCRKPRNKKPHICSAPETVAWNKIHPEVDVNDEYVNDCPEKVVIYIPDEIYTSNKVHMRAEKSYLLDCGVAVKLRKDAKGIFGRTEARVMYHGHSNHLHFRYRMKSDFSMKYEERVIMSLLLKGGSQNCLRVLFSGHHGDLRYTLTTKHIKTLDNLIDEYNLDVNVIVHLIDQTFICMSELHKLGYCYTVIRPSAFGVNRENPTKIVFTEFPKLRTFKEIDEEHNISRETDLDETQLIPIEKLTAHPYMSRRQHLRSFRGPGDDYESWFYVCARMMNKEPLKWENQTDPSEMLISKYDFPSEYGHPNPEVKKYMSILHQYALSATINNRMTIAYFIRKVLDKWKARHNFPLNNFPWIDYPERRTEEKNTQKMKEVAEKQRCDAAELAKEWEEWKDKYKEIQERYWKEQEEKKKRKEKEKEKEKK